MSATETISSKVINFSPGPAKLPEEVLNRAQKEMLNYRNTGVSVMELSHRSQDFNDILNRAQKDMMDLLDIPDDYSVLFLQGGGTGQFSAIPCNLMNLKSGGMADYVVTGTWSAKAAKEAEKYGKVNLVLPKTNQYTGIPDQSEWNLNPDASYVYYCDNETVHGIEFQFVPETNGVPIVCDMSSNILTKKVDVSKYGVIFAGAQKNIGCAGCTVVIIRNDLIGKAMPSTPAVFCYKTMERDNSLHNTPPTYRSGRICSVKAEISPYQMKREITAKEIGCIYIMGLVLDWIKKHGGVEKMAENSKIKSEALYKLLDNSSGFFSCPINKDCRSRVNVVFRIGSAVGEPVLEKKFLEQAEQNGMIQLKGHRSVGGIRASLYNAVSIEEASHLHSFMEDFLAKHRN